MTKVYTKSPAGMARLFVWFYLSDDWGGCPKSQTFLSKNRESASGLVWGYGVFQSREDFSDSLGALIGLG